MIYSLLLAAVLALAPGKVTDVFAGRKGAYVQIDCSSGSAFRNDPFACAAPFAPCSTFKIWNTAIGFETGIINEPGDLFWKWDGIQRAAVPAWNQDQTLQSAFAVSCVPAYQNLARKIGKDRMETWIKKIDYGDKNIDSGLDVFWLPAGGRKTILISANEQAEMIARLTTGKLPFSTETQTKLKEVMKIKTTVRGTLFGKTGTGLDSKGEYAFGWFVGYVESGAKTYAFACRLEGNGVMGKDARAATESILAEQGLL